jgi:hypothetical protein
MSVSDASHPDPREALFGGFEALPKSLDLDADLPKRSTAGSAARGTSTGHAQRFSPTFPTGAPILEFCRRKLNLFKGR